MKCILSLKSRTFRFNKASNPQSLILTYPKQLSTQRGGCQVTLRWSYTVNQYIYLKKHKGNRNRADILIASTHVCKETCTEVYEGSVTLTVSLDCKIPKQLSIIMKHSDFFFSKRTHICTGDLTLISYCKPLQRKRICALSPHPLDQYIAIYGSIQRLVIVTSVTFQVVSFLQDSKSMMSSKYHIEITAFKTRREVYWERYFSHIPKQIIMDISIQLI